MLKIWKSIVCIATTLAKWKFDTNLEMKNAKKLHTTIEYKYFDLDMQRDGRLKEEYNGAANDFTISL